MGHRLTPKVIARAKSYVEDRFGTTIPAHALYLAAMQAEHLIEYFTARKITKIEDILRNPETNPKWKHAATMAHQAYTSSEKAKGTV